MNASDEARIWYALALAALVVVVFFVLEASLIAAGRRPITTYARRAVVNWPGRTLSIAALLVFALGMACAHFVTDAGCG